MNKVPLALALALLFGFTAIAQPRPGGGGSGGLTTNTGIASSSGRGTNTTLINPTAIVTNTGTEFTMFGSTPNYNVASFFALDTTTGYGAIAGGRYHAGNSTNTYLWAIGSSLTNSALYNSGFLTPDSMYIESIGGFPYAFVGGGLTEMYMNSGHHSWNITDFTTATSNFFNFNRDSGNSVFYGTEFVGGVTISGVGGTGQFTGSGAGLTALPAAQLTGTIAAAQVTNASFAATLAPVFSAANLTSIPTNAANVISNDSRALNLTGAITATNFNNSLSASNLGIGSGANTNLRVYSRTANTMTIGDGNNIAAEFTSGGTVTIWNGAAVVLNSATRSLGQGVWTATSQFTAVGLNSTDTNFSAIAATGYTNSLTSKGGFAYVSGTAITYTNFDGSGVAYMTNTTLINTVQTIYMQAGAKLTAASGLSGTFHAQ